MDKKKLLELSLPELPKSRNDAVFRIPCVSFIARVKYAENRKMLIVAFYSRSSVANGFPLPSAVLYLTKDDYITLINRDGKQVWKKTKLANALQVQHDSQIVALKLKDQSMIDNFWKIKNDYGCYSYHDFGPLVYRIEKYQSWVRDKKNSIRKKKICARVDQEMKVVPRLPTGFHNWVQRGPLRKEKYIYFRKEGRTVMECYCTHCRQLVRGHDLKPKDKKSGVCPCCGAAVEFRSTRYSDTISLDADVSIVQRVPKTGEYLLRFFCATKSINILRNRENETQYQEYARLFFTAKGEITRQYKNGWSGVTDRNGWYPTKEKLLGEDIKWKVQVAMFRWEPNWWFDQSYLYPYNIHNILKENGLSFDIKKYFYGEKRNVTTYLLQCFRYPFVTSLNKLGLTKLSNQILYEGKQLNKIRPCGALHRQLHISKDALKMARHHNFGYGMINTLTLFGDRPPIYDDLMWIIRCNLELDTLFLLMKHATIERIRRYLAKQFLNEQFDQSRYNAEQYAAGFWKDYLQMALELEYDISKKDVLCPSKLKDMHDKLRELIKVKFDPEMDKKIQAVYPVFHQQYYYEDEDYIIRPPRDFNEFIEEGATLLHCVCTSRYYIKHVEKTSLIFFVRNRKDPETPLYTMEFRPSDKFVVQLQGKRHCSAPPNVNAFVAKWKASLASSTKAAA